MSIKTTFALLGAVACLGLTALSSNAAVELKKPAKNQKIELTGSLYSDQKSEQQASFRGGFNAQTTSHSSLGIEANYKKPRGEDNSHSTDMMVKANVYGNGMDQSGLYASAGVGTQVQSGKRNPSKDFETVQVSTAVGYRLVDNFKGFDMTFSPEVRTNAAYNLKADANSFAVNKPSFGVGVGIQI